MKNPNKVHLLIIFLINQVNACKPSKNAEQTPEGQAGQTEFDQVNVLHFLFTGT